MSWIVNIQPRVTKEVQRWRPAHRLRFERLVDELQTYGPWAKTQDVKQMAGKNNRYRARIGGYRVLYEAFEKEIRIYIFEAGTRGDIYK